MSAPERNPVAGTTPLAVARSYAIPFSEVWAEVLKLASTLRGWEVLEKDSTRGRMRLKTANRLGYRPVEAQLRLWLDELGQTRLEVSFPEARGLLSAAGPARGRRLLGRLDRALERRRRG